MAYNIPESDYVATIIPVPTNIKRGVEVKITKLEHFPANGAKLEEAVLTVEDANGTPNYIKFPHPKDTQISIKNKEMIEFTEELGIKKPERKNFSSYEEYIKYHLHDAIGKEGRVKIVYSKNVAQYNPEDEKLQGKSLDEIKKLRRPFNKVGSHPFFFRKGNDTDFTFITGNENYHDHLDYTLEAVVPDGRPAQQASAPTQTFTPASTQSGSDDLPF